MKTVSGTAKKDKKAGTGIDTSALLPLGINGKSMKDFENYANTIAIRKVLTQEQSDKNIVRNYEALPNTDPRKQSMQNAYSAALENEISRFVEKNEGATRYDYLAKQRDAYDELLDFGRAAAKVNNGDHTALSEYNDSIDALMAKGYTKVDALNSKALADQLLAQERNKKVADFSNEHPVLGTLASFATNLMVPSEFIDNMIAKVEGRSEQHQNNRLASETTAALRSGASEDMGKTGKYLYNNVLMPLGDNATNILAGGGIGSKAAGAIGAAQMANAGYNQAKDNGASDNQALATAAAWAAAEYITEGISLGNLKSMKASGKTGLKNALKDIGKQMAVEGTEEAASEIIDQVADYVINGDFSSYSLNYNNYLMRGMSRKEAKEATMKDVVLQIGNSALGGAITGGIMGGGVSVLNNIANTGKGNEKALNTQLPFVKEALQNQANQQVDNGENLLPFVEVAQNTSKDINEKSVAVSALTERKRLQALDPLNAFKVEETSGEATKTETVIDLDSVSNAGEKESLMQGIRNKANNFWQKVLNNNGQSGEKYNQVRLSKVPSEMAENVKKASGGRIDISDKFIALEGGKLKHEIERHSDAKTEAEQGQISLNSSDMSAIVDTIYSPDYVEYLSGGLAANQRETFALIKADEGYIVVVENVGGKQNPNIVPEQILHLSKSKMSSFLNGEKSIAEIVYAKGKKRISTENSPEDIKNRVTVAQPASNMIPVAPTPEAFPHSPLSNDSISNSTENVNVAAENNTNNQMQTVNNQPVQQGDTERGYNKTFVEKTDAPQELKDEFINNPRMYNRLHNADTKAKADAILQENDTNTAVNEYYTLLNKKDPAAVPLGYNLSKQLLNEGRKDEAVRVIEDMSKALTESGQFSQAAAITMLNNDPDAAMLMLMRKVDSMNEAGREKFGKKWKDFELRPEEQQMFESIEVGDAEAIEAAYQQVYDRISREYPATMKDKLMEYRRVAMLLNVRTNVRNVASNALMLPIRWTGDRVAALGEGVYKLIKPDYERTQSLNPFRDKQTREIASEAWEQVKDTVLDSDSKYQDTKDAIRDKQVFKGSKASKVIDNITNGAITKANKAMGKNNDPSLLETARNFTYWLLEQGDNIFVRANFKSRMMSYIDAQRINSVEDIPADAYVLATQEAMKATFKDDTRLSRVLSEIKKSTGIVGEMVLPFTKTPANLAMRGIDYSPAGLAEAGYKLKKAQSHAEVAEAMTLFGQSATGSAAILLGMVLAEAGLISGALSEDKDEAAFQKQQGMLPYAIKVGDNYYSYDWAQPAAIPLILGATIQQSQEDSDSFWHGLGQGAIAAADSWLELSPLQNLSDIFGGYGTPAQNVADVLMQFPLSFIPAQLGAATRIGDTAQRTTFDNTNSLENIKNQAMAKVPGLSELLPLSYDTWGNPINRQDSTGEAVIANLLNPGQFGNSNVTPLDSEVTRLFGSTGDNSVFPKRAAWSQTIGGETVKFNNEQYSEYQRIMGENSYDMVSNLMKSTAYSSLSDTQKVEAIGNIYNFANALAKSKVLGYDIANVDTYKKAYEIYEEKGAHGVSVYYAIKEFMDGSSNSQKISAVDRLDVSEEDKGYYLSKLVAVSKKAQMAYEKYGYSGLYQWYKIYGAADTDGNGSVKESEMSQALKSSNLPFVDQVVYMQIYGSK